MTYFHGAIIFAMLFSAAVCTLPLCTEGEEDDCAKCYDVLASQVILNARNRYNLQQAFFPPDKENPVFLEVIYKYDIETTNGPIIENLTNGAEEVWFWTDSGYYFFQPIEVIQLTSLFFADYGLRKSSVTLHLRQDCRNASNEHMKMMTLFTQRLELYAKKQSIHAEIDDSYIPKAVSVELLNNSYTKNEDIVHVSRLAFASQFVTPLVVYVLLLATWIYYWEVSTSNIPSKREQLHSGWSTTKQDEMKQRSKLWTVERHSVDLTVQRFLIVSVAFCLYVIAMDIAAMYNAINTVDTYTKEYYGPDTGVTNFSLEFGIVFLIFVEDILVLLVTCAVMFCFFIMSCWNVRGARKSKPTSELHHYWSLFVYAPLGPMMCVVIHGHQILIGFIHAPYHATSVLVFYGILFLAFFHSFKAFHNILRLVWPCRKIVCGGWKRNSQTDNSASDQSDKRESDLPDKRESDQPDKKDCCKSFLFIFWPWKKVSCYCDAEIVHDERNKKSNRYYCFLFLIYGLITVVSCGLIVFIVAFFVLVPIDNAIDDAPNQLLSIERTVVLVLAITVVYKLYSKNSHTILWYILKAKDEKEKKNSGGSGDEKSWDYQWAQLEDEEKFVSIGTLLLEKLANQSSDTNKEKKGKHASPGDRNQEQNGEHVSPGDGNQEQNDEPASPDDENQGVGYRNLCYVDETHPSIN